MTRTRGVVLLCAALLTVGAAAGCGYYNSLYNAQNRFANAEREAALGNMATAFNEYDEAIARAAVSVRRYPDSRWADDALLLIGRAHFGKRSDREAGAAMERLLRESTDPVLRGQAFAYLGAVRVRSGAGDAVTPLDSALAIGGAQARLAPFMHLWRARARFASADTAGAWQDLDAIAQGTTGIQADAGIERLRRAVESRDSSRWIREMGALTSGRIPTAIADSIRSLLQESRTHWGAAFVNAAMPATIGQELPELQRLQLRLSRAEFMAAAGDTALAITAGTDVARASDLDVSSTARVRVARWLLATVDSIAGLSRVRSLLLPAFGNPEALSMIRGIRAIEVLADRSEEEPVAMFVAAEFARDDLFAPLLARVLFLRFAALPGAATWRSKALIAALDLSTTPSLRSDPERRLASVDRDLYVDAVRGAPDADADAYAQAEAALRMSANPLRREAIAIAAAGDVSVSRAVALRDSIRTILMRDSLQLRCTVVVDSLVVKGVRRDSTHSACMRSDSARVNAVLRMDTTLLKPKRDTTTNAALAFRAGIP